MEEFLKDLTDLCRRHNKYLIGSGDEGDITLQVVDKTKGVSPKDAHIAYSKDSHKYEIEKF